MKKEKYHPLTISKDVLEIVGKCFKAERRGDRDARFRARNALRDFLIKTADGSYTLKSNALDGKSETMHTYHGAVEESLEKFVKPSNLKGKGNIHVLDICSGLGYNASSCIEFLKSEDVKIKIDMIEISKETLATALIIPSPVESHKIIKKAIEDKLYNKGFAAFRFHKRDLLDNIRINLFCGDARDIIKKMENYRKYDAVFLDPFSPAKSPELYTVEFFHIIKNRLKNDGTLSTYTSAASVRSTLIQVGFHVGEGPSFGKKAGTIASASPKCIKKPLSVDDERMVALSDAGIPFRDPKLVDSGSKIAKRRECERKNVRGSEKLASTVKTPIYLCKDVYDIRLKRRVLRNLGEFGIDSLKSKKSRFIVCPQFEECICGCETEKLSNSSDRIREMSRRLSLIKGGEIEL